MGRSNSRRGCGGGRLEARAGRRRLSTAWLSSWFTSSSEGIGDNLGVFFPFRFFPLLPFLLVTVLPGTSSPPSPLEVPMAEESSVGPDQIKALKVGKICFDLPSTNHPGLKAPS